MEIHKYMYFVLAVILLLSFIKAFSKAWKWVQWLTVWSFLASFQWQRLQSNSCPTLFQLYWAEGNVWGLSVGIWLLLLLCWCFVALWHFSGHFEHGQLTYPHYSWASLLGSLPVLSAHSFASNWRLPFLNQRKGENGCRNYFMTNLHGRMLPDKRIEPATVCIRLSYPAWLMLLFYMNNVPITRRWRRR